MIRGAALDGARALTAVVTILPGCPVLAGTHFQGQTLRGIVSERQSYQPIELVTLVLLDAQADTVGRVVTDERGYFSFDLPESGTYSLVAYGLGYQAIQSEPLQQSCGVILFWTDFN